MGPISFISDNWWDDRDNFWPVGVGMVPRSMKPYFGPVPAPGLGPLIGDPNQWSAGLSYADYIAAGGSPATPCQVVPYGLAKVKAQERTGVSVGAVGGCRAVAPACPGELIPCVLYWTDHIFNIQFDSGTMTWDRVNHRWRGAGTHQTLTLTVVGATFTLTSTTVAGIVVTSITCGPLAVFGHGPGTVISRHNYAITYPG